MNKLVDYSMYVWFLDLWVNYYKLVDIIELVYNSIIDYYYVFRCICRYQNLF